jgi:hypothetical protein
VPNPIRFAGVFLGLFSAASAISLAQTPTINSCTQDHGHYSCDEAGFAHALRSARTVATESQPFNHASEHGLEDLARDLGKTAQAEPADLTFVLVRPDAQGLFYGPAGRELAYLRVFAHGTQSERGSLVWVETYNGQPDLPWPAIVHQLIRQFRDRFK